MLCTRIVNNETLKSVIGNVDARITSRIDSWTCVRVLDLGRGPVL